MSDEFDDLVDPVTALRPTPVRPGPHQRALAPRLVTRLYAGADRALRQRLLACLLAPLGPLGLAGVAAGAFAGLLQHGRPAVAADDALRYTQDQILELARFVEQVSPQALQQVAELVAANPLGLAAFSASAALLLMRLLRRRPPGDPQP